MDYKFYSELHRLSDGIYLDNAASAEFSASEWMAWGNPSSKHRIGRQANKIMNRARLEILEHINAPDGGSVIFTSGGTEANNLAIIGLRKHFKKNNIKRVITSPIEHPSVLNCCAALDEYGVKTNHVLVDEKGAVDLGCLERLLQQQGVGLVSIQMVNSEIGTMQPLKEIGEMCKEYRVLFHVDAVQGYGHYPINVKECNIDFLTISGHKVHTIKGIGALYAKDKNLLSPVLYGGGQQYGLRSGTENTQGIYDILDVTSSFSLEFAQDLYKDLFVAFEAEFKKAIGDIPYWFNGSGYGSHILSLTIPHVEGTALALVLDSKGVYVSTGSACHSNSLEASEVLKAIGLSDSDALCTIRISFSDWTSCDDVSVAGRVIGETARELYDIAMRG